MANKSSAYKVYQLQHSACFLLFSLKVTFQPLQSGLED